jgi:tetratricopeptide (TPR) repeat protein
MSKKKHILILLFFQSFSLPLVAGYKIDSLKNVIAHSTSDTEKINTLIHLGYEVGFKNPDTALLVVRQALNLSRSGKWEKGIINAQYNIGLFYELKGDLKTAISYEDSALAASNEYNNNVKLSSIYNELGNITSDQDDYTTGLDYYFKALSIDSMLNPKSIGKMCNNIGLDYEDMGNYPKAEEYLIKAEKAFELQHDESGTASIYSNLGNLYYIEGNNLKGLKNNFLALKMDSTSGDPTKLIPDYQNIGLGYLYLHNHSMAMLYTYRALNLSRQIGELGNIQKAIGNIGQTFLVAYEDDTAGEGLEYVSNDKRFYTAHAKLLDSALVYEQNSIAEAKIVNDRLSVVMGIRGVGDIYEIKKDYAKAIACFKQAYGIADSLGLTQQKMELSLVLGHTLAKAGDYKASAQYLDNVIHLKDTLFSIAKSKQMAEMEARYENEKKQKEIEELAQKNEIQNLQIKQSGYLIFGLISLVLIIIGIGFLWLRQNRIKTLHTKIELQQKLLRSQMNPHFIFNAMTSIQNFIYKEEPQKAADYLSSVFKLMRSILEGSKHEYVSLEKEISTLRYYLILQQLCYQHKFDFVIDVDAEMDTENINVPPMIAQPFIENAIEHGISNKTDGKGMVTIRLKQQGEKFRLEIEDNGIGREKANEINKHRGDKHLSVATNITQERITLLNGNGSKKISMKIIDLRNGAGEATGTKVVFEFPLHELT